MHSTISCSPVRRRSSRRKYSSVVASIVSAPQKPQAMPIFAKIQGKTLYADNDDDEELPAVWKSKFYGAFVLNHRVVLHAIDAMPARWRGDAGSSPLDRARTATSSPRNDLVKNCRVHPTHWLISTQFPT